MRSALSFLGFAWAANAASQCPQSNVPTSLTGQTLRIAAVGDSITVGASSSTYDGYRRALVNLLDGNQVNMIGYHTSGQGRDTQVHAQIGDYVNQIQAKINMTWSSNPNVYLIHAGSNNIYWPDGDCNNGSSLCQDTANQLATLIDIIHNTTKGQALIVVAQVVPGVGPAVHPWYQNNTQNYNADILQVVRQRDYPGTPYKIQVVNMQNPNGGLNASTDISGDGLHPNDSGYSKMAQLWYNGIVNASYCGNIPAIQPAAGYITKPCGVPFSNNYTNGVIVQSRGQQSTYGPLSCSETSSGTTCNCKDDGPNNFTVTRTGNCREMSIGFTSANRWADLNGDGRQENIWVGSTGLLNISLNLGGPTNSNNNSLTLQSRYRELGGFGLFGPSGVNAKRYQVALADLDGDARAEYMVIDPTGNITGYWNQGSMGTLDNDIQIRWAGANTVSATKGVSGIGVRLVDWDGDGRADYVWVGADAEVKVWLNKANTAGTATVTNWVAQGSGFIGPAVPSGSTREQVILADINADGRADYLLVDRSGTASNGRVTAYLNLPPNSNSVVPNWSNIGVIVTAAQGQSVGSNGFLNEVQFADPDGDGAYDYVVAGAGDSSVQGWRNGCIPWSGDYN